MSGSATQGTPSAVVAEFVARGPQTGNQVRGSTAAVEVIVANTGYGYTLSDIVEVLFSTHVPTIGVNTWDGKRVNGNNVIFTK